MKQNTVATRWRVQIKHTVSANFQVKSYPSANRKAKHRYSHAENLLHSTSGKKTAQNPC